MLTSRFAEGRYKFRRAKVGMIHVPRQKLVRLVDMCNDVMPVNPEKLWRSEDRTAAITEWQQAQLKKHGFIGDPNREGGGRWDPASANYDPDATIYN